MLSFIPPAISLTIVIFALMIGIGVGKNRDLDVALAREMMQVHSERSLQARSSAFDPNVADLAALPGYPWVINTGFTTEIVDFSGDTWIITWPTDISLSGDNARSISSQLALLGYTTPGRSSLNDFKGPYDALNGMVQGEVIPDTVEPIPDLHPVIASRYQP